ncbi:ScbA/BarX family gamma-butyrolactone biosynthesis protein [Streptomyces sp. NPDC016845]|uniref:ScbA/BarX family gamma-butyrolactone biosynthesis protein n=1 Tax=Streptomyces sp. NPDC016845 TaxID=3364972 RepID=UPI00378C62BC
MLDLASRLGSVPHPKGSTGVHVPRTMVHKTADDEVLLASAARITADRFAVRLRWPDEHLLHHRRADGTRDSLVVAETMRQAGIYLSHRFHDVPADYAFVLHRFDFRLTEPVRDSGAGADAVLDIQVQREPGNTRRFRMESVAWLVIGGRRVGRATMKWDAFAPRQYAVIRHRAGAPDPGPSAAPAPAGLRALPAALVGRDRADAVLLAEAPAAPGSWWLRMDTGHPALFDHASDHTPGMVLVEAFRQAVLARVAGRSAADWTIRHLDVSFHAFGQLGVAVEIVTEPVGQDAFQVVARQGTRPLASARAAGCADATGPAPVLAGAAAC